MFDKQRDVIGLSLFVALMIGSVFAFKAQNKIAFLESNIVSLNEVVQGQRGSNGAVWLQMNNGKWVDLGDSKQDPKKKKKIADSSIVFTGTFSLSAGNGKVNTIKSGAIMFDKTGFIGSGGNVFTSTDGSVKFQGVITGVTPEGVITPIREGFMFESPVKVSYDGKKWITAISDGSTNDNNSVWLNVGGKWTQLSSFKSGTLPVPTQKTPVKTTPTL